MQSADLAQVIDIQDRRIAVNLNGADDLSVRVCFHLALCVACPDWLDVVLDRSNRQNLKHGGNCPELCPGCSEPRSRPVSSPNFAGERLKTKSAKNTHRDLMRVGCEYL